MWQCLPPVFLIHGCPQYRGQQEGKREEQASQRLNIQLKIGEVQGDMECALVEEFERRKKERLTERSEPGCTLSLVSLFQIIGTSFFSFLFAFQ